jgi:cobalt/nickel transport protein
MREYRNLWIALVVLALLSPLGLYLPELARAGAAWGEWGLDQIQQALGYVPAGMERMAEIWKAPLPDYTLPGPTDASLSRLSLGYLLSAFLGMGLCGGGAYLGARWLIRRKA